MGKSVFITGCCGVGKSAVLSEFIRRGYVAKDIEKDKFGLYAGFSKTTGRVLASWDNANLEHVKDLRWLCDPHQLKELIDKCDERISFYGGAGDNLEDLFPFFDQIIVLQASEDTIRQRLLTRYGNDYGRTVEIQDWIFSNRPQWEEIERRWADEGAIIINSDRPLKEVVKDILMAV